jgi:membrane associated rhomboid family serine protease
MVLIIVVITSLISIYAFSNAGITERLSLKPTLVYHKHQYYRILSHSLIHADWTHLIVNMYVLFIFGDVCNQYFEYYFGAKHTVLFLALYIASLIFSSLFSIFKHRNNQGYSAIGASGAVMAIVFTSIFFDPWNKLWFFGIIPIPGILFGIIYLIYSLYMGKKNIDNIGHDAHFTGAVFGFLFPLIVDFRLLNMFIEKLLMR